MKKYINSFLFILIIFTLLLSLSSCGDNDDNKIQVKRDFIIDLAHEVKPNLLNCKNYQAELINIYGEDYIQLYGNQKYASPLASIITEYYGYALVNILDNTILYSNIVNNYVDSVVYMYNHNIQLLLMQVAKHIFDYHIIEYNLLHKY